MTACLLSPSGLDGSIKALFFSKGTDHIKAGDVIKVVLQNGSEVLLTLSSITETKNPKFNAYLRFLDYDTPEKAKALSAGKIYIKREKAHPLEKGEVYTADLQDMNVIFKKEVVGSVVSIIEMSNGVLLEVKCSDGKKFLLPYKEVFIGDVDIQKNTLELKNGALLGL